MFSGRTLPDVLQLIWRRKHWILVPVLLGAAGAYGVYLWVDPIYRGSTLILVEPQKVPSDYIKSTVTSSLDHRLRTIEQQIKSRENLDRILAETGLYADLMADGRVDEARRKVFRNLLVQVRGGNVFWIHFDGKSPDQVAIVANYVADAFIGTNLRLREGQAENTTAFLTTELGEMKKQLEQQEGRVATFRLRNDGFLPEQRSANEAAIGRLQAQLRLVGDQIDAVELRALILEQGLPVPPGKQNKQNEAPALTPPSRLSELRDELTDLRMRYTDRHPEVIRLQQEVERLQAELAVQQRRTAQEPRIESSEEPETSADPVRQAQLEASRVEMQKLRAERQRTMEEIAGYEQRLERTARIELELVAMTRDYDNLQRAYNSLLTKKTDASLAENMEKGRQSEQFTIIERAYPPKKPHAPDLLLYLGAGMVGAALIGIGLVVIREETDQRFDDADDLRRAFPLVPILASVPTVTVLEEESSLEEAM